MGGFFVAFGCVSDSECALSRPGTSMRTQGRCTFRRPRARCLPLCLIFPLAVALGGCAEETHPPVPDAPGSFLLDTPWQYESTTVATNGDEAVPFPTDQAFLATVHYPAVGEPATGDALDGSLVRFGADSRILVEPPSFTEYRDLGSRYSVVDSSAVRVKLDTDGFFSWAYYYDRPSGTLLLDPEPDAGRAVLSFVCDVLTTVLVDGALDGAAAAVAEALSADPRVMSASSSALAALATLDSEVAAEWLLAVLSPQGILDRTVAGDVLAERLRPVVKALASVERDALTDTLVSALLDAGVLAPTLSSERAEKVIRFVLYRKVLVTTQNLATIERIELELELERDGGS